MGKFDDFYHTLQQEKSIIPQLEDAQQKKVIKSFKKLMKSECFASWDRGLCEWCDEPIHEHECKHSGSNWEFLVIYDDKEDYVIAMEFYNNDDDVGFGCELPITKPQSLECEPYSDVCDVGVVMVEKIMQCAEQAPWECSMPKIHSYIPHCPKSVQHASLVTNHKESLHPILSYIYNQPILVDLKSEWSAYFDYKELHSWGNNCLLCDLIEFEPNYFENMIHFSLEVEANMMENGLDEVPVNMMRLCLLQVMENSVKGMSKQHQNQNPKWGLVQIWESIRPPPRPPPMPPPFLHPW